MAVLRRGEKFCPQCPAMSTPLRSVKLKISSDANQALLQLDIESTPRRADSNEAKVGESLAKKLKQILWNQIVARQGIVVANLCVKGTLDLEYGSRRTPRAVPRAASNPAPAHFVPLVARSASQCLRPCPC